MMVTLPNDPRRASATAPQASPSQLPNREMAELLEAVSAREMIQIVESMTPEARARYDVRLERIGSAYAQASRTEDVPFFNRVVGLGLREPVTDDLLDAIFALYRGANVRFMLQMSPVVLSPELHERLEARGLVRKDNWVQLIRGVEPPPAIPTDLRIERVGREYANTFAEIVCTTFGLEPKHVDFATGLLGRPGWRHYLAFDGDRPVATGALYVQGGVGYLTFGATLESHRRRGAQGAIMAQRIRDAAALGCQSLVTIAVEETPEHPNPSLHNMLRTGFHPVYARPNYVFFPNGEG